MTPAVAQARQRRGAALLLVGGLMLLGPAQASAQVWAGPRSPHAGSVEVSAGVVFTGAMDLGGRDAEETRNINTGSGPFALFSSASKVAATPAAVFRAGVYLSRAVAIEGGVQYGRATLSTTLSGDAEQAPDLSADDMVTRYLIEGTLVLHLQGLSFASGRGVPFLAGGGGSLRELHEGNALVETGREYHAGGGVKIWLGARRKAGLRADVGVSARSGGIDFTTTRRMLPAGAVSLVYRF